jgi:hypothetical protein
MFIALAGCGGRPLFGDFGKRGNSYVYKEEQVAIRMLTFEDLKRDPDCSGGVSEADWIAHVLDQIPGWADRTDPKQIATMQAVSVPTVVGLLAGFAVDTLKAELERETELYEAQFGATHYDAGFWKKIQAGEAKGEPLFYGIEVVRQAAGYGESRPAYRFICAIAPARDLRKHQGACDTDERLFALVPLYFQTNASRAKVFISGSRLDSTTNLAIDATWIDAQQSVHQERIAAGHFEFKGYDLKKHEHVLVKNRIAGWFGGFPVTYDEDGKPRKNGAFKVLAIVTEADQGQARKYFERVARYLGENREKIITAATKPSGS